MLCTCFSTVPGETQSACAIPALVRPCAISASTSCSRFERSASGSSPVAEEALPGQNTGADVAAALNGGAPGRLGRLDASVAGWTTHHGTVVVVALVFVEALIGLAALSSRSRGPAVAAGFVLALAIWVIPQDVGQLYSGQATDPNTALIIALMAVAVLGSSRVRARAAVVQRTGRPARRDLGERSAARP